LSDFIREVEEDIRRERMRELWDRFGLYVIGAVVAIVAGASAVVGWQAYSDSASKSASDAYIAAEAEAEQADPTGAADAFAKLAADSPSGYAALAMMQEAAALTEAGDPQKAATTYLALADKGGVPDILKGLARLKAAFLLADSLSYSDLRNRIEPLADEASPWRSLARELLGSSAMQAGLDDEARGYFQAIIDDTKATPAVRDRARMLIALVAEPAEPEAPAEAEPAAGAEPPATDAAQ